MARRPLIAGNWKMYKTLSEAGELVRRLIPLVAQAADRDVVVFPPFISLASVAQALTGTRIRLGAQNLSEHPEGAFTGEVSAAMIKDAGASHAIIGHSERRQLFGETDALVNAKTRRALSADLVPIVCVGETLAERDAGRTLEVIGRQVAGALNGLTPAEAGRLLVAYEPVWAIGTGRTATPAQAQEVHAFIRKQLIGLFGDTALGIRILYGGSVKPDNIDALMAQPDVDGGLVGGASLSHEAFSRIVNFRAG